MKQPKKLHALERLSRACEQASTRYRNGRGVVCADEEERQSRRRGQHVTSTKKNHPNGHAPSSSSSSVKNGGCRSGKVREALRRRSEAIFESLAPHLREVTAEVIGIVETASTSTSNSGSPMPENTAPYRETVKGSEGFGASCMLRALLGTRSKKENESDKNGGAGTEEAEAEVLKESIRTCLGKEQRVISQNVYGNENFQICIFIIPVGEEIPLHNHPGMTVLSKAVYGSAHIQKYKWSDGVYEDSRAVSPRKCQLVSDTVLEATGGGVEMCCPEENIHRIVAITDVAILDVFVPPYDVESDRDCQYYDIGPYEDDDDDRTFTLVANDDTPFQCFSTEYEGLKVRDENIS